MAAQLTLYTNNSDPKRAFKSLANAKDFGGGTFHLKEPLDSLHPVIQISKEALGENWWLFNYARIPKFNNRYYFAKFITQRGEIMEYQLDVDVLMTYKTELIKRSYMIERCESSLSYSLKYADSERPMQADKWAVFKVIGNLDETTGGIYTLTVAGGGSGV